VAPLETEKRHLALASVGQRSIALARELDCAMLVASQVNVVKGAKGQIEGYTLRETAMLEHCAHAILFFVVEYVEDGDRRAVKTAHVLAQRVRGFAPFKLQVAFFPHLFLVEDMTEAR
jgi:replicative DNA helicase